MITNPSAGRGLCSAVQSLENSVKNSNIKKRAMHEGIMEYFFFLPDIQSRKGFWNAITVLRLQATTY
jgi:hypothetical protein